MKGAWRIPALLVLGTLLMQAAWLLALPPFRGTDEIDHAYRAAAVAAGQWRASGEPAKHGRGELVRVPRSIVSAARPVCTSYTYTGHDNCYPVRAAGNGHVVVASASASYNPVFYAVVGSVTRVVGGDAALYAMRVVSALLCAAFVALAAWALGLWARSGWPVAALVVAASPVAVFSMSIVAPNGLEMCAALGLWSSLLGLHTPSAGRHLRSLLLAATASAVVLTTLRSIGPLWVALIVLTTVLPLGRRRLFELVRRAPGLVVGCSAVVVAATLFAVWWTRSAGTNSLEPYRAAVTNRWTATLGQLPLWLLQSIAAFPRRGIPAPGLVYICAGVAFSALVVAGFVVARRRWRLTLTATAVVALVVPIVATLLTISVEGPVWQGRYGLPYAFGLALVAAAALDDARTRPRPPWMVLGWALLVIAQVLSVVHVTQVEQRTSPLAGSPDWVTAPWVVVGLLTTIGFALWGVAAVLAARTAGPQPAPRTSDSLAP